jgi:hypothetical protein
MPKRKGETYIIGAILPGGSSLDAKPGHYRYQRLPDHTGRPRTLDDDTVRRLQEIFRREIQRYLGFYDGKLPSAKHTAALVRGIAVKTNAGEVSAITLKRHITRPVLREFCRRK